MTDHTVAKRIIIASGSPTDALHFIAMTENVAQNKA